MTHSYHIFMFPFRWTIKGLNDKEFGKQISFDNIHFQQLDNWERVSQPKTQSEKEELFNEKNYFYEFVHDALYDKGVNNNSNVLRHYERMEPKHQEVTYSITVNEKVYELTVEYINLNLYSTGVGVLSFYMKNEKYAALDDVLKINQFGRRVYPPYFYAKNPYNSDSELAKKIEFKGLNGVYEEDFSGFTTEDTNKPAGFITKMIAEVASNLEIKSVIDDRMYVMSWYKNDEWVKQLCDDEDETFLKNENWYKYVFVDGGWPTCQNDDMLNNLLKNATYKRWQKWHSLYGISRYSFVFLTNAGKDEAHLYKTFETEYVRMAELILVQKASVLRFSAEVTNISSMEQGDQLPAKVSSLYKEYIRFVNQIHFREVSAQDQAIEIYDMLYKTAKLEDHVKKLDEEIDELYEYVSLAEDRKNSRTMSWLTTAATILVPATVITAVFGMNNSYNSEDLDGFWNKLPVQLVTVFLGVAILILIYKMYNSKKGGKR